MPVRSLGGESPGEGNGNPVSVMQCMQVASVVSASVTLSTVAHRLLCLWDFPGKSELPFLFPGDRPDSEIAHKIVIKEITSSMSWDFSIQMIAVD